MAAITEGALKWNPWIYSPQLLIVGVVPLVNIEHGVSVGIIVNDPQARA